MNTFRKTAKRRRKKTVVWALILLLLAVLFILMFRYMQFHNSLDASILGALYTEEEMLIPTPTPSPTPAPANPASKPKFAAEYAAVYNNQSEKTVYLTFDDGPTSNITPQVLDILKQKNVRATFFVLGMNVERYPEIAKRIGQEGHLLANHSYSHDYASIYANSKNFMDEIKKAEQVILDVVGEESYDKVFRFPGGSFERSKDKYKEVLFDEGYVYIDWNALNGDAEGHNISAEKLLEKAKNTAKGHNNVVMLMHDSATKTTTVEALPRIIDYLREEGYIFKTLKRD